MPRGAMKGPVMNTDTRPADRNTVKNMIYLIAVLAAAVLSAILRTAAIFVGYDADIGYFARGKALPVISNLVCVLAVAAAVAFPFFADRSGKGIHLSAHRRTAPEYFATAYAAFVMLGAFGYEIYRCIADRTVAQLFERAAEQAASNAYTARGLRVQGILIIIGIVASAISAIYFFLRIDDTNSREWHVLLGFAPGLRGIAGLAEIYFDMTVEMNSPNKLILQAALISAMFYFVYELRMILGGKKARPRAYVASGLAAVVLTLTASVSVIAGYFSGRISNAYFFTEAFFCFNMFVYISVRTVAYARNAYAASAPAVSAPDSGEEAADADEMPDNGDAGENEDKGE